jgi:hypothetical protein
LDLRSKGQSNATAGWPLSELAVLQQEWRKAVKGVAIQPSSRVARGGSAQAQIPFSLDAYKRQNIDLLYRNEELAQDNLALQRVNENLKRELELMSNENSKLKAAHLSLKRSRTRLRAVK